MIRKPGDVFTPAEETGATGEPIDRRTMLARLLGLLLPFRASTLFADGERPRAPWNPEMEVAITFKIGDPRSVAARRPYVAVYVESVDGDAVRTIALWTQRQIAWLRQLRHWYRSEVRRQRASGGNLVHTLTSPTRRPGTYTVVWDGRDNDGAYVEQGRYAVFIETIRENAGNHMVREEFDFGARPFESQVEPYASIADVVIEYRRKQR